MTKYSINIFNRLAPDSFYPLPFNGRQIITQHNPLKILISVSKSSRSKCPSIQVIRPDIAHNIFYIGAVRCWGSPAAREIIKKIFSAWLMTETQKVIAVNEHHDSARLNCFCFYFYPARALSAVFSRRLDKFTAWRLSLYSSFVWINEIERALNDIAFIKFLRCELNEQNELNSPMTWRREISIRTSDCIVSLTRTQWPSCDVQLIVIELKLNDFANEMRCLSFRNWIALERERLETPDPTINHSQFGQKRIPSFDFDEAISLITFSTWNGKQTSRRTEC